MRSLLQEVWCWFFHARHTAGEPISLHGEPYGSIMRCSKCQQTWVSRY